MVRKQFSRTFEKNWRENCCYVSIFIENSGEKLGLLHPLPPDRQINHYQQAVVMRNRSFVKHACTRTQVPHIDSPSNTFHNRANRRANTRRARLSAKNPEDDFPAGILIIITPFHLRSTHLWEKWKKKNGAESKDWILE